MVTQLRRTAFLTGVFLGLAAPWLVAAEEPKPTATPVGAPAWNEAKKIAKIFQEAWPDRPEWLDMFTSILNDEDISPNHGWYRTVVTQTRFGWEAARMRYDVDGNSRITRNEFPGSNADFARLDRHWDGVLTEADFHFSAPPPSRGMLAGDRPSKAILIRGLFHQELGSLQPGPKLDEPAPDFTLKTYDGKSEITLSKQIGPKPLVLIFGNFTCGPFRSEAWRLEKLHSRYGNRANFLMVYVREVHPTDGWRMESNDCVGVAVAQPTKYAERAAVAQRCEEALGLGFPLLVDTIDDAVGARYSGMPSRLYIIDGAGEIAFKSGRGPFGFNPDELEQSLVIMLQDEHPGLVLGPGRPGRFPAPGSH